MKNLFTFIFCLFFLGVFAQEQKNPFQNGVEFISDGGVKITVYEDCASFHHQSGMNDYYVFNRFTYDLENRKLLYTNQNTLLVVELDDDGNPKKLIIPDPRKQEYFEYKVVKK